MLKETRVPMLKQTRPPVLKETRVPILKQTRPTVLKMLRKRRQYKGESETVLEEFDWVTKKAKLLTRVLVSKEAALVEVG